MKLTQNSKSTALQFKKKMRKKLASLTGFKKRMKKKKKRMKKQTLPSPKKRFTNKYLLSDCSIFRNPRELKNKNHGPDRET